MTKELRILCGIPGVGKTTWANKQINKHSHEGHSVKIVSRDPIRFKLLEEYGGEYFDHEGEVYRLFIQEINDALSAGTQYIYVDATHINAGSRNLLLSKLHIPADVTIIFDVFNFPVEVAIERNSKRDGLAKVPNSAIYNMKTKFKAPTFKEWNVYCQRYHLENNSCVIRFHKMEE